MNLAILVNLEVSVRIYRNLPLIPKVDQSRILPDNSFLPVFYSCYLQITDTITMLKLTMSELFNFDPTNRQVKPECEAI